MVPIISGESKWKHNKNSEFIINGQRTVRKAKNSNQIMLTVASFLPFKRLDGGFGLLDQKMKSNVRTPKSPLKVVGSGPKILKFCKATEDIRVRTTFSYYQLKWYSVSFNDIQFLTWKGRHLFATSWTGNTGSIGRSNKNFCFRFYCWLKYFLLVTILITYHNWSQICTT